MKKLKKIISLIFNININKVNDKLTRVNEKEWDSFNHLLLISEIEKEMGVKFTITEVEKIKTFKELREMITYKKSQ